MLEVVYLIFNEGYVAARGEHWLRPQLCQEALHLEIRVLTSIAPHETKVHGLLALMEFKRLVAWRPAPMPTTSPFCALLDQGSSARCGTNCGSGGACWR